MIKLEEIQERYDKLDAIRANLFWAKLIFEHTMIARNVYPEVGEGLPQAIQALMAINENVHLMSIQLSHEIDGTAKNEHRSRKFRRIIEMANKFNYEGALSFSLSKAFKCAEDNPQK